VVPPHVRVMQGPDLPFAVDLTATEGWGYTEEDFLRLQALEPEGCLVLEHDGRPLGIATVTTYGVVAWIGAVIVRPTWRGKGAGRMLLEGAHAFCARRGVRSARLNAYLHIVPFYEKLGYRGGTENGRFTATGLHGFSGGRASPPEDLAAIIAFDARAFGASRERLLRRLEREPGGFLLAVDRGGHVLGYAAGTVADGHCEIGPMVVARGEPVAAQALLEEALGQAGVRTAALTVPVENREAVDAVRSLGFGEGFHTLRMTRGDAVADDLAAVWALGGLEKG